MTTVTTRKTSIRSDSLSEGVTYDFEVYKNGESSPVMRRPATVISVPGCPVKDMGSSDAVILQIEGGSEISLVRNNTHPFYLVTRVGNRNCRVRFHSVIGHKVPTTEMPSTGESTEETMDMPETVEETTDADTVESTEETM